ncbi:hypothetical protein EDB83DRAFT_2317495 [Lactarius deliciosus]|nr:hypothetical protein EDB83DRAFT_2317495 [Lactarius deliciosus]
MYHVGSDSPGTPLHKVIALCPSRQRLRELDQRAGESGPPERGGKARTAEWRRDEKNDVVRGGETGPRSELTTESMTMLVASALGWARLKLNSCARRKGVTKGTQVGLQVGLGVLSSQRLGEIWIWAQAWAAELLTMGGDLGGDAITGFITATVLQVTPPHQLFADYQVPPISSGEFSLMPTGTRSIYLLLLGDKPSSFFTKQVLDLIALSPNKSKSFSRKFVELTTQAFTQAFQSFVARLSPNETSRHHMVNGESHARSSCSDSSSGKSCRGAPKRESPADSRSGGIDMRRRAEAQRSAFNLVNALSRNQWLEFMSGVPSSSWRSESACAKHFGSNAASLWDVPNLHYVWRLDETEGPHRVRYEGSRLSWPFDSDLQMDTLLHDSTSSRVSWRTTEEG